MSSLRKIPILLLILLAGGAIRMPVEKGLSDELHQIGLLHAPLSVDTRDKLGQTGFAVALGGLRTLVATFFNLRAYTAFTEDRWRDLSESYDTMVALAPHTTYYWSSGSWHLYSNAATQSKLDENLTALRRQELWRAYVQKGHAFLERGIRNNPDNWFLKSELGNLLSSPFQAAAFPDRQATYEAAAEAYRAAASEKGAPPYLRRQWLYALARLPGREAESLALAEELYNTVPRNRPTTLLGLLFTLRMHHDPDQDPVALADKIFSKNQYAYLALGDLWENREERNAHPVDGIAAVLPVLESRLSIPWEHSFLNPNRVPPKGR